MRALNIEWALESGNAFSFCSSTILVVYLEGGVMEGNEKMVNHPFAFLPLVPNKPLMF